MNDEARAELLQKIIDRYSAVEVQLLEKLARLINEGTLDTEELDNTWTARKLANIRRLKKDTAALLNGLALLDDDVVQLLTQSFLTGAFSPNPDFLGNNGAALNNLVSELLGELRNARFQILRQTLDGYRSIIGEVTQNIAAGVTTRIKVAKDALNRFAGQGITAFISKDGRRWEITTYTEMATRTATLNAYREGRVAAITANGDDLVIINSVPNPSPLCKPYERRILSVSGKSDKYTSLSEAKANGLFHVQCRHSFTKYVPGLTKTGVSDADRGYDDYEATQEQRYLERKVREWKRRLAVDPNNAKAKDKIKAYQGKLRDLVAEYDLVRKYNRESNTRAR